MATLTELFAFYTIGDVKLIAWGGKDWGGNPQDEMHFQMGYNTWNNPLVGEFIRTKIRADGFSTFRRGGNPGVPVPQPTPNNAVTALWKATGITAG
jgi:putative chitinase